MKNIDSPPIIKTNRLVLRQWSSADLESFACMNADPRVREYFPGLLAKEESDAHASRMSNHIERLGWGFFAVSLLTTHEFIGFIGLEDVESQFTFAPGVEIGWRLECKHWGKGYATEGALACLHFGFETLNLNEIVSYTTVKNEKSRAVMKKIGMNHNLKDDFDNPKFSKDHPLRPHVLYKLRFDEWKQQQKRS